MRPLFALGAFGLLAILARPLDGHEVPVRVAVSAWIVPTDNAVEVFVRVPLEAMRDLDFPVRDDSMLDLVRVRELLQTAATTWIASGIALWAAGEPLGVGRVLAARLALPADRAFSELGALPGHFSAPPLDNSESLPWRSALFDVHLRFDAPLPGVRAGGNEAERGLARLEIEPALAHLGVRTTSVLRLALPSGAVRVLTYTGDVGRIALEPGWIESAWRFARQGFAHILGGLDHLLFLLCLILPVRRWRPLVAVVTAFTLAHSLTLGAAALGWVPTALWFPPLVEVLIAASIIWLAVENVVSREERLERRWVMAFAFGLIHGFGFAFALRDQLQFAGAHLATALGAFNVGVEVAQLATLALAIPLVRALRGPFGDRRAHLITWVGSAFIAHSAWHWMTARLDALSHFRDRVIAPTLDATFALGAMRVALLGTVALALALALRQILRRFLPE